MIHLILQEKVCNILWILAIVLQEIYLIFMLIVCSQNFLGIFLWSSSGSITVEGRGMIRCTLCPLPQDGTGNDMVHSVLDYHVPIEYLYKLYILCERDSTGPVEWIRMYFSPDPNPDLADPTPTLCTSWFPVKGAFVKKGCQATLIYSERRVNTVLYI